jgi:PTH1 family peptidyl-tRNA hydrolase
MIRLIVGLGNPGKDYKKTRHNAGAWFIEQLCQAYHVVLSPKANFHGQYAHLQLTEALSLHTLIPTTFMNQSGRAVSAFARYYKIGLQEMLIAHDELDFPAGVARLKLGGGAGGHNGLSDIIRACRHNNFWRLRIGIGHPGDKSIVPQYVLGVPRAMEYVNIQHAIQNAMTVLPDVCRGQTERAMHTLHSTSDQ